MSGQSYFVKIRGRVLGPFPPARLIQMAQQGQLSRVHMLSDDGNNWQRASDFPELFSGAINPRQESKSVVSGQAEAERATQNAADMPAQEQWHYGVNEQSFGPVPKSTVVNLIKSGQLAETDLLWQSGMDAWVPVSSVPEFAILVGSGQQNINVGTTDDSSSKINFSKTSHIIRSQTPWVFFLCVCVYLVAVGLFFAFILGLVQGAKFQNGILITEGIVALVHMFIVVTAAVFLQRYASASNRFTVSKKASDLNTALRWLGRFWLLTSIVLIIWLILFVIMIIYAFTLSGAVFP